MNSNTESTLGKARRDICDATEALANYWSRSLNDTDYKCADLHMAVEALARALSSVALAVERIAERSDR